MVLIRSLVFQAYFFASVAVIAFTISLLRFMSFEKKFALGGAWARSMMTAGRIICGFEYAIEGEENIPDQPCVIMLKHTSVFEAYAQLALFPPQTWVVKRELLRIPFFGWGLAAMRPIAIDRGVGRTAVTQVITQGKALLADGIWLTIFPEGTRVRAGETRKYGISGAALAMEAGVPILPVAHNAGDLWPRRSLTKKPGLITISIGPPIDASGRKPKETNLLVQAWIERKMAEISTAYSKDG